MVARAKAEGRLDNSTELLEPSSGNTGIALARIAAMEGIPLTVMVPDNVSPERVDLLEAFAEQPHHVEGKGRAGDEHERRGHVPYRLGAHSAWQDRSRASVTYRRVNKTRNKRKEARRCTVIIASSETIKEQNSSQLWC